MMYCPVHFQENDGQAALAALIKTNPLAIIVRMTADGLTADHVPLFYEDGKLIGHVAKANALWQTPPSVEILVIFQGANAYISPSWYATKQSTHQVVPTWNYTTVHVRGQLSAIFERQKNLEIVQTLTNMHEQHLAQPWSVEDAPKEYIEAMLNAIVGIEISISRIEAKWKVSQNQPVENQLSLLNHLNNIGDQSSICMAEEINKKINP